MTTVGDAVRVLEARDFLVTSVLSKHKGYRRIESISKSRVSFSDVAMPDTELRPGMGQRIHHGVANHVSEV